MVLSKGDRAQLKAEHPDLVRVIERAGEITTIPFKITEGLRSLSQRRHRSRGRLRRR